MMSTLHEHGESITPVSHARIRGDGDGGKYLIWDEVDLEIGSVTEAHFYISKGYDGELTKQGVSVWRAS
jgi:hypothetical protein